MEFGKGIAGESPPPLLKIEWIEIESPYLETWPPRTHTDILFANDGLDEKAYAREVLRRFATRAYRGPLAPAELDRLMDYWTMAREDTDSLEVSLRETLGVVLSSPRFLGLPASRTGGAKERLTDHELASRLSYFLWSTMPDETLLRLADEGKLHEPAELSAQVRRMIQDRRAWSFIEQFAEQWLDLDRLQRVVVHQASYPGFDDELAAAMRLETIHFFGEVLRGDMSIFAVPRLRLHVRQRPPGGALRHRGRHGPDVPQGAARREPPPRRRPDARRHPHRPLGRQGRPSDQARRLAAQEPARRPAPAPAAECAGTRPRETGR